MKFSIIKKTLIKNYFSRFKSFAFNAICMEIKINNNNEKK